VLRLASDEWLFFSETILKGNIGPVQRSFRYAFGGIKDDPNWKGRPPYVWDLALRLPRCNFPFDLAHIFHHQSYTSHPYKPFYHQA
jgi:hypothetical protein